MQSLMQKLTTTSILLVFLLASAHADDTAAVPNPLNLRTSPATIQFVKVYTAYAQAVRDHDINGMKTFVTPDFALRGESQPLTGKAAFKELVACGSHSPGTRFSAAVHPLSITQTDAVVLTQETYTFPTEPHDQNASWSFIYDWKQTWRKTPQGWKLASMKRYHGDFADVEGFTFTVLSEAKIEPAKAQAKQNIAE